MKLFKIDFGRNWSGYVVARSFTEAKSKFDKAMKGSSYTKEEREVNSIEILHGEFASGVYAS